MDGWAQDMCMNSFDRYWVFTHLIHEAGEVCRVWGRNANEGPTSGALVYPVVWKWLDFEHQGIFCRINLHHIQTDNREVMCGDEKTKLCLDQLLILNCDSQWWFFQWKWKLIEFHWSFKQGRQILFRLRAWCKLGDPFLKQ